MSHEYDLFEKFPDGSSLWRGWAKGLESARHHISDLAKQSPNQFYAINVVSGKTVSYSFSLGGFDLAPKIARRTRAAAA